MKNRTEILIIKLGALGDVINTLPLSSLLHDELDARITWIVEPLSYPIVNNHYSCEKTILFNKKKWRKSSKEVVNLIKNKDFDLVIDLQRILKSAYFTIKAGGKRKLSFDKKRCKEMTWIFPFEKIAPKDHESRHMLDQYMEFASHLGISIPDLPKWKIPNFEHKKIIKNNYIVLNTGATKPANKWFEESFAALSDRIYEETDLVPVLTGGPEDIEFSGNIISKCGIHKPIDFTGKTSLEELVEILRGASYIISCDTGPMHLGVALGIKVAALFGPSNPFRTGPYFGKVITGNSDCMPCNKKRCETRECMKSIHHEKVFNAVFYGKWSENQVVYVS